MIEILFWIFLGIIFYAYLGYGLVLYLLIGYKRWRNRAGKPQIPQVDLPSVTLLVSAYNEADHIKEKVLNSLALNYPKEKLQFLFVTDGSDDETPNIVATFPEVRLMHSPARKGKLAAVHRAMPTVSSEVVVFSDANTLLNPDAILNLVQHYGDPQVGAVSGEKRVMQEESDTASAAGESLYWRYESILKRWDAEWYSAVGAAGELFSVRTHLFRHIPKDTLIEDFYLTMSIAMDGNRIAYEADAYAMETASMTVAEEEKRKIRICAGAFQAMWRLREIFNPLKHGKLSFQFISHRALRWSLAPLGLVFLFGAAPYLAISQGGIYLLLAIAQGAFYLLGFIGYLLEQRAIRLKVLFVPYYFLMMNTSVFKGLIRYLKGQQSVTWEKAQRKVYQS